MGPWVVCDEQLLYAESLAAALRRRGAEQVTAVAYVQPPIAAGTLVLSLRAGVDDVSFLRAACPEVRLVCLTSGDPEIGRKALASGADVVLPREGGLDEVLAALDPRVDAVPVRRREAEARASVPFPDAHLRFLTFRERETLDLLVAAKSTEMIAREMQITTATARGYVQSILEKLCVHSRLEAVAYAARHASVPLDQAWCSW